MTRAPWLGLTVALALTAPAAAQTSETDTALVRDTIVLDTAYATRARSWVGERLLYDVRFGILRLGTAEMQVRGIDTIRGREALHIRFRLDGGLPGYRLHNQMDSWLALDQVESLRFVQDNDEGGRQTHNAYEIYPDSGFYRREGIDTVIPTSHAPLDDAAFFYFVRGLALLPDTRYELHRYFKRDRNPVVLEVLGRDTLDLPAGRFATIVVRPIIRGNGIFKEGADGQLWLTDDADRRVVQIKSRFFFGRITLRLREVTRLEPEDLEASAGSAN